MLVVASVVSIVQFFAQSSSKPATVTPADYSRWKTEFRNWERWGKDDERGTTNLIRVKEREPAFLGHDFNIDWNPRPGWGAVEGIEGNPIHQMIMKSMGVSIVENLDLERVVETARRLKHYEFMITFAPLPVEGGTGSPVNPLAIF